MTTLASIRLLHFEGDRSAADATASMLRGMAVPCDATRVGSPALLREALARGEFDVIVATVAPHGSDGVEALEAARELRPDVPFIYHAGAVGEETVARLLRRGAADYVLADGEPRLCDAILEAVRAARGARERRLLEERLLQSQKMEAMGQLAAGIAHDFNNILSVVLSYSRFVLEELPAGHPVRADVEEIQRSGERGAGLVRQLLAFGRKQATQPRETDVNEAVKSMGGMVRRLLGEHVRVEFGLDPAAGHALVDPTQLAQVLVNLALNARDAMPRGGTLTLSTARLPPSCPSGADRVRVSVADTGTGIPPDVLPRIFEPFFTTKAQGKGTGLGLAMAHGAVAQNGGTIEVESAPGRGTTFHVALNRVARLCAEEADAGPEALAGRGETVLVVEDDEGVRRATRRILANAGYRVIEAADGDEAVRRFVESAGRVALVVTDMIMPGMGGGQLGEELNRISPGVRIVYTSGYSDEMLTTQGTLAVGARVLEKPIERCALLRIVREALDAEARD